MNMRTTAILLAAAAIVVLCAGCFARLGDVSAVSTKNIIVPGEQLGKTEAEMKTHIICIFPTKKLDPKEIIDKALDKKNGDMLVNARLYMVKSWWIPFIYGQMTLRVEGEAIRVMPETAKPAPPAPPAP
jgi:hypothetical protein